MATPVFFDLVPTVPQFISHFGLIFFQSSLGKNVVLTFFWIGVICYRRIPRVLTIFFALFNNGSMAIVLSVGLYAKLALNCFLIVAIVNFASLL